MADETPKLLDLPPRRFEKAKREMPPDLAVEPHALIHALRPILDRLECDLPVAARTRGRLSAVRPRKGVTVFKFELKTVDGDEPDRLRPPYGTGRPASSRHPAYEGAVDDKSADDDCE